MGRQQSGQCSRPIEGLSRHNADGIGVVQIGRAVVQAVLDHLKTVP